MTRDTDTGIGKTYLERRAEAEISLAQAAAHPAAVRAHYLLAGFYLDRLYGADGNDASSGSAIASGH